MSKLICVSIAAFISFQAAVAMASDDIKSIASTFTQSVKKQSDTLKIKKFVELKADLEKRSDVIFPSKLQGSAAIDFMNKMKDDQKRQAAALEELGVYLEQIHFKMDHGVNRIQCNDGAKDRIESEHRSPSSGAASAEYTPFQAANDILTALCP